MTAVPGPRRPSLKPSARPQRRSGVLASHASYDQDDRSQAGTVPPPPPPPPPHHNHLQDRDGPPCSRLAATGAQASVGTGAQGAGVTVAQAAADWLPSLLPASQPHAWRVSGLHCTGPSAAVEVPEAPTSPAPASAAAPQSQPDSAPAPAAGSTPPPRYTASLSACLQNISALAPQCDAQDPSKVTTASPPPTPSPTALPILCSFTGIWYPSGMGMP